MRSAIGAVSFVSTFALVGCGGGPIAVDDDADETTSADDAVGTEGGDTGDGTGDEPPPLACGSALRFDSQTAEVWLMEDGVEIVLPLMGNTQSMGVQVAAAGDYIAISRSDGNQDSIVHVFSRSSAELLWARELPNFWPANLWVSDDGWVVGFTTLVEGFLLSSDQTILLPDHQPREAPVLGRMVANNGSYAIGWLDLDDLSWQPTVPEQIFDSGFVYISTDHTLEYPTLIDGAPVYARARPGQAEFIPLPFVLQGEGLMLYDRAGSYRLVEKWIPNDPDPVLVLARVDLETAQAVLVDPLPPPGWEFFDCYKRTVRFDSGGRVFYTLHNGASVRLWAYDVDQDTWTPAGLELGLVEDIETRSLSKDVFFVEGRAQNVAACPVPTLGEPPPDALVGDSQHLVRLEPPLALALPATDRYPVVDRQQQCVALKVAGRWQMRPLDGSDEVIDIGPGGSEWLWLD